MTDLWPALHRPKGPAMPNDSELMPFSKEQACPTCDDASALTDNAGKEIVCTRCGTIVDIPLDWTAEYRWFSNDSGGGGGSDPSRCGFPINPLLPESSLGTIILNQRQSPLMRRIKRYHMWNLMPYRERTLWGVFETLSVRASNAGISNAVLEEAKELYAQLAASQIARGQAQRDAMLAACLWEALKRHDAHRLPRDVADMFQLPLNCVTKGIKQFQHVLTVRTVDQKTDTYTSTGPATAAAAAAPDTDDIITARAHMRRALCQARTTKTTSYEDFITPFLTNLSIPAAVQSQLEDMVRTACARTEELNIVPENTPPSLTASVIAFCMAEMRLPVDHIEIARVCGISAVTIQKCLKRMVPHRVELIGV
jgi:transcription initiation factor TFIIB